MFSPVDDFIERSLDLNELCIQNKAESYIVQATGDSMAPEILADDYLVVDRSLEARDQDKVVCVLDGEFAAKRLRKVKGEIYLEAANPNYKALKISEHSDFQVWGVIVSTIRVGRGR
jgi:DNA polymerase V